MRYVSYGPPQKQGYPPTIRLSVGTDRKLNGTGTKSDGIDTSNVVGSSVTQAPISNEYKENRVKLTSLSIEE